MAMYEVRVCPSCQKHNSTAWPRGGDCSTLLGSEPVIKVESPDWARAPVQVGQGCWAAAWGRSSVS